MERTASAAPAGSRAIPLSFVFLAALAVHVPLLLMGLPLKSYDTNFHIFFASHYLHHWFDPWNPKWYAGFSQTTYPPLPQQWLALVSLCWAGYGVYGGAVGGDTAAGAGCVSVFAAVGEPAGGVVGGPGQRVSWLGKFSGVFRGTVVDHVCRAAVFECAALSVQWVRHGNWRSFLKGGALFVAAAAAHHATLLFGSLLFCAAGAGVGDSGWQSGRA